MTGFNSKRDAAADKLQEPAQLTEKEKISREMAAEIAAARALAQPAQEPLGMVKELFTQTAWEKLDLRGNTKVYTTPPQREWVGLTNEEIKKLSDDCVGVRDETEFIRAIEQALKEKNT